jgi:hypothetical protein
MAQLNIFEQYDSRGLAHRYDLTIFNRLISIRYSTLVKMANLWLNSLTYPVVLLNDLYKTNRTTHTTQLQYTVVFLYKVMWL